MEDLTGFKKWYETARLARDAHLAFTWDIARSAYTEFHYQVMTDKLTDERFRDMLWSRFSAHGESAMKLMLAKLDSNEDPEFHPQIIFCLGLIADQQKLGKMRTLEYARKFVSATSEHHQCRTIWQLLEKVHRVVNTGWEKCSDIRITYLG